VTETCPPNSSIERPATAFRRFGPFMPNVSHLIINHCRLCAKSSSFFASIVLVSGAYAAPQRPECIDTLLAATKAEKLSDSVFDNMDQMMRRSMATAIKGQNLSAAQQRFIDAAPTKFAQVLREEMSWSRMRPLYIQIYEESFTQEEIDGLIAFYKSPVGIAFVEKMPLVMQKSMTIMQSRMGPMMEKMKAVIDQAMADAKAAK